MRRNNAYATRKQNPKTGKKQFSHEIVHDEKPAYGFPGRT
jgi:hypothetical protein